MLKVLRSSRVLQHLRLSKLLCQGGLTLLSLKQMLS